MPKDTKIYLLKLFDSCGIMSTTVRKSRYFPFGASTGARVDSILRVGHEPAQGGFLITFPPWGLHHLSWPGRKTGSRRLAYSKQRHSGYCFLLVLVGVRWEYSAAAGIRLGMSLKYARRL